MILANNRMIYFVVSTSVLISAYIVLRETSWSFLSINYAIPPRQILYLLSKASGLCAFVLLVWQICLSLLAKLRLLEGRLSVGKRFHISMGASIVVLTLLHAGTFVAAASVRSGHLALHILIPNINGYYQIALSLGVFALLALIAGVYFGSAKKLKRSNHYGHYLVFLTVALVYVHAYLIGSEIQSGLYRLFYWSSLLLVSGLLFLRLKKKP